MRKAYLNFSLAGFLLNLILFLPLAWGDNQVSKQSLHATVQEVSPLIRQLKAAYHLKTEPLETSAGKEIKWGNPINQSNQLDHYGWNSQNRVYKFTPYKGGNSPLQIPLILGKDGEPFWKESIKQLVFDYEDMNPENPAQVYIKFRTTQATTTKSRTKQDRTFVVKPIVKIDRRYISTSLIPKKDRSYTVIQRRFNKSLNEMHSIDLIFREGITRKDVEDIAVNFRVSNDKLSTHPDVIPGSTFYPTVIKKSGHYTLRFFLGEQSENIY